MQTLIVSTLFILLFSLLKVFHSKKRNRRLPPGPPRLPIIGNLHQLISGSPMEVTLAHLARKYAPDLMTIQLGSITTLVVSSATIVGKIFKEHDVSFSGRPSHYGSKTLSLDLADVIWAPYGEYWREMRKIATLHLFSSKMVRSFSFLRGEEVALLIEKIDFFCSSDTMEIINLTDLIHYYVNNVIFRIAFGKRFDDSRHGNKVSEICDDSQKVAVAFSFKDHFPFLGWVDRLTGLESLVQKTRMETYSFIQDVIDEHREAQGEKDALVDVLIRLRNENSFITHDDQIKTMLADVLVAGTETSSATLVWVMSELMKNPRVMTKVQEEVRATMDARGSATRTILTEEDAEGLPYMKAVIKEMFRLDPVTPLMVPRQIIEKCVLEGYELDPGIEVLINTWEIGRDPKVWSRSEEFWPERFMDGKIDLNGQTPAFIPFGAGRRRCPGMTLATATVELALANLLYSFDWKVPAGLIGEDTLNMEAVTGVVRQRKTPLRLHASKYRKSLSAI